MTPEQTPEKKVVSPFELAITEIADPEAAKNMRAETREEQQKRIEKKFDEFLDKIRYRTPEDKARMELAREIVKSKTSNI